MKHDYSGFLQEEMNERLRQIQGALSVFATVPDDIRAIKEKLDQLEKWANTSKLIQRDLSRIVNSHEKRLLKLEGTA
ncbi:MAG TPA: hypothetical protein VHB51_02950 [Candidatus Saccharimonadales bacterium]|nr:hypothetical protein [Candidatus Saccharimonadales bacterium]